MNILTGSLFSQEIKLIKSIELSSSSETDNIIQEGEVIFKENRTVGLPEVSRLIDSAISKRNQKCLACNAEKTLQLKLTKKE